MYYYKISESLKLKKCVKALYQAKPVKGLISKITSFSVETIGTLDGDGDFKIWLSSVGVFEIKFRKKMDIEKVGKFLSERLSSD